MATKFSSRILEKRCTNVHIRFVSIVSFPGPQPVGVQCPSLPHLVSFQAIGTGSGNLGYCPCWCPNVAFFPSPSISGCFSIHSLSPAVGFHSCFFFMTDVSALIRSTLLYSLI